MSAAQGFTSPPIWELVKREGTLRAGEREFKGHRFFELRIWADGDKPTGKGVTMPPDAVASLARVLTAYVVGSTPDAPHSGS